MAACPRCGEENSDLARFCSSCGAALQTESPASTAEERKVVSVLFVDLVGFTARSDRADPEDVRAALRVYHDRLKREIERFGGTVEKFVGDAVMAVFGAPVAHENDAERAVRSALRIVEAIGELNEERPGLDLSIRAAVNTGEAVVTLGARPELGEGFVTGDVVNVASRLQGVAPVGGVVVGGLTNRATRDPIEYEALEPVIVKGKDDALPIWLAIGARSRFGVDVEQRSLAPLIGRDHELNLLQDLYIRAARDQTVQLVTVVGEPGVGKSRLAWEFQRFIDDLPDLITWRQGRCLPYGEGITFWALGEVVKSHAGILENDAPEEAADKLRLAVSSVVDEEGERDWIRSRLEPLVGLGEEAEAAERAESFAAWRSFLESIASASPFVLVIEDLHWADPAMLAFVEHLADWASGVPLFVLGTARPELYERDPAWGGGKRNHTAVSLVPLTPEETAQLIAALPGPDRPARRDPVGSALARGREPALRRGVHPDARRPRRAGASWDHVGPPGRGGRDPRPGDGPGADRGPPRHPPALAQDAAPGRGRDRQGLLGGRDRGDGRHRRGRGPRGSTRVRTQGAPPSGATTLDRGRVRVRLLARADPRRRVRPDPSRHAGRQAPRGRRVDRADGGGAGRGQRGAARLPLRAGARARPRCGGGRRGARGPGPSVPPPGGGAGDPAGRGQGHRLRGSRPCDDAPRRFRPVPTAPVPGPDVRHHMDG